MLTRHLIALTLAALTILGPAANADAPAIPSTDAAINQALNRLTFGPGPGDAARVKREGLQAWIERQLNPSRIDDRETNERLARLSTLSIDSETLAREVHQPARRERQRLLRENTTEPGTGNPEGLPPQVNDIVRRDRQIITDLSEAKVLRAIYSDRQLEEVLVDFWFNHFNVFAGKGRTRVWLGEFEREAIRPNVLGNFRTMVGAVAKSPAMLIYLDNWMNVDPESANRQPASGRGQTVRLRSPSSPRSSARLGGQQTQRPPRRATGLNENYARELMELHTLGVDGGYTQPDVVSVARAFTGWTLAGRNGRPHQVDGNPSDFRFDPRLHDAGEKTVLGHTLKGGGGIEDGERVLDILVAHPSTAHFIAEKLARRFVSDTPPEGLVKRAAAVFSSTHGDLRETLRAIITSPEFFAAENYRAKVKTPFEFVVSAFRATQADVQVALPVVRELRELGMPLYLCQPPTGYDDTASTWVSSGALVSRMNFALAVGGGRLRGVTLPFTPASPIESVRAALLSNALAGSASAATLATIEKASSVEQTVALALGSPEFQRK
jgi:uncharacterized protein (DUF1800 family)